MGGGMEEDVKQEFKHARDTLNDVKNLVNAVSGKLDMANQQFNTHLVEDARSFKGLEMRADALHHRLDETERLSLERIVHVRPHALHARRGDILMHADDLAAAQLQGDVAQLLLRALGEERQLAQHWYWRWPHCCCVSAPGKNC